MIIECWKPFGATSNWFAQQIKHRLSNCDKICYAGRLDPFAQGVMLLCTDQDTTSYAPRLMTNAKTYRFKLVIGAETHSNDLFGRIEWVGKNEDDDVIVGSAESVEFELVQFAKDYRAQRTPAVSSYFMRDQVDGERKPMWKAFNSGNLRDEHVKMRPVEIFNANILGKSWISGAQLYESMKRFSRLLSEKTREDLNVENLLSEFPQTIQARQQFLSLDCEFEVSSGFFVRQFCYDFSTRRFNIPAFAMEITRTRIFAPKDIPIIHIDSIPFSSAHTRSSITLR